MGLKKFLLFSGVGVIGFLVDSGLLMLIISFSDAPPVLARFPSFLLAATVTWVLNGWLTFRAHAMNWNSWVKYISVNGIGFSLNYLIYAVLIWYVGVHPFIAVAIASVSALIVNFLATSRFVFGGKR